MVRNKKNLRSTALFALVFITCISCLPSVHAAVSDNKLINRYPIIENKEYVDLNIPYYLQYIEKGITEGYEDTQNIASGIDLTSVSTSDGKSHLKSDAGVTVFDWSDSTIEWAKWEFSVPATGYYNIEMDYTALEDTVDSPRRAIDLDGGRIAFREMSNIVFDRFWYDDGDVVENALGDQVRPRQAEKILLQTARLRDALGRYDEPLKFYLEAGIHSMKMTNIQGSISFSGIRVLSPLPVNSYSDVLAQWRNNGAKESTSSIKINAENPAKKTDSSMRLEFSSDPMADPATTGGYVLNAIGGDRWNKGNQGILWTFDVPADGLYKMDMRVYQKYNDGLSTYRQILVDGKVPYKEFLSYEFTYMDWNTASISDANGNPYLIYLEKGNHTLEMVVKTSHYMDVLFELEQTLGILSKVIQNTIMITGISPDVNFDYRLQEKTPWAMDALKEISAGLGRQVESLTRNAAKTPGPVNSLLAIRYRVDKMIQNPFVIASNLNYMIDDQTTLSTWIKGFNNSPLKLDYMILSGSQVKIENKKANALQISWFALRNFLQSFVRDYDSIPSKIDGKSQVKTVNAWISRGKEWGEILKQITDEDFTKTSGINVNMNILPPGQLGTSGVMLLAVASGTAPDFVLGSDSVVPAEYGMRDVLVDLSALEGYDTISKRFLEGALIPYQFKGKVFALPETMDFSVMYYRKDIMASLNLSRPDTWEEVYTKVLPVLKQNGMDFWYEGGLNTFLFQNNGSFYSEDGLKSGLDTEASFEAFKQFSDLYKIYDVPVSANFYTRFRAGQMPIGISSFNTYLMLTSAAPEIQGKWGVSVIPGTLGKDGVINRSNSVSTSSIMIFQSSNKVAESWEFFKWYTKKDVQVRYAGDIVAYIGPEAKWCSANIEAFDALSWDNNFKDVIVEQREFCKGVPNVVGGYITARQIENARVRAVIQQKNYRESLEKAVKDINRELVLKNEEFTLRQKQTGLEGK